MSSKEYTMDRFDAGKEMQEQVRQHKEQAGPSQLERLLNSQELPQEDPRGPKSRSEEKYPEAYRGGNEEHWKKADMQHEYDVIRNQAIAQEKVGYEDDTEKFFMDDPDNPRREPLNEAERLRVFGKKENAVTLESLNGPPLVFGGMLLGISLTLITLIWLGKLEVANTTNWYIFSGIGAAVGLMYAAQLRT
ncbi:MAG: hypothetical protein H7A35_07800 [Planctomycetales bacterium]|nr:hypothetical protein [bacterium]UNM09956.1 MAG: hypothetical protein H7A35_07800 [Planctomycetales bacterium]